ncbi:hypothetical protein N7541_003226 [Penicillium brevicompactum]|uniref:Uncharacterized protein n=1 Tax=Penicillium brevicompactum TaxID=5074 RepID=A0A9W9UYQ9_PENBR|nr:hypothetical protein N7541_003226 [Penicillium brevicompactum]
MPPIDYSKWDNIDTDSDSESGTDKNPPSNPDDTKSTLQPKLSPSTSEAKASEQTPAPDTTIKAVTVLCVGTAGPRISPTTILSSHPIFTADVPPIPALLDFPVVVHRLGTPDGGGMNYLDNPFIKFLHISPEDGTVPPQWQTGIGSAIVARKDKKDLPTAHFEAIIMYCDQIWTDFHDGYGPPEELFTRNSFVRWYESYKAAWAPLSGEGLSSVPPLYED